MKKGQILVLLLFIFGNMLAQKSIKELANYDDKKFNKLIKSTSYAASYKKGLLKYYQAKSGKKDDIIPQPKKVGLYTYFLTDFSQMSAYAMKHGGILEDYLTEAGGSKVIDNFYNNSLSSVKKTVADQGFTFLTSDEYLDSDKKKDVYNNTDLEISKIGKMVLKSASFFTKTSEKSPTAMNGYVLNEATTILEGTDAKLNKDIGYVIKGVGLDAIISVQVITNLRKKKLGLQGIKVAFHGANPIPDEIKWVGAYYSGILLGYSEIMLKSPLEFAVLDKKGFQSFDIEGFDKVLSKLINSSIEKYRADYLAK